MGYNEKRKHKVRGELFASTWRHYPYTKGRELRRRRFILRKLFQLGFNVGGSSHIAYRFQRVTANLELPPTANPAPNSCLLNKCLIGTKIYLLIHLPQFILSLARQ
uniref:Uncharacterized protein n=1 Tax=Megaselia scalaris TaxID=36166 RepID=T1GNU7_MEGSC